ncbi:MAG: ThuA domain-containing protein [Phycisphaerales bacterium]
MVKEFARLLCLLLAVSLIAGCQLAGGGKAKKCVVVWSEGTAPKAVYPSDINGAIAEGLKDLKGWEVVTANLSDPDQGLPDELLNRADVLIWWGHQRHDQVKDQLVDKIARRVKEDGMGFISLHSSHFAKPNKKLMGTACSWGAYLGDSTTLQVTVKDSKHPIAKGVKTFTIVHNERYSDPYAVPTPQSVVFEGVASLKDGGIDPSQQGFTWQVGKGRFFYFQPGHETNPVFFDKNVRKIMINAVKWAAPK